MTNLATAIGTSLEPAFNSLITVAGQVATSLTASFEASDGAFKAFAKRVVDTVKAIPDAWDQFVGGIAIVMLKFDEFSTNTGLIFMRSGRQCRSVRWIHRRQLEGPYP